MGGVSAPRRGALLLGVEGSSTPAFCRYENINKLKTQEPQVRCKWNLHETTFRFQENEGVNDGAVEERIRKTAKNAVIHLTLVLTNRYDGWGFRPTQGSSYTGSFP